MYNGQFLDFPDQNELLSIFHKQTKRFKINFSHSFLNASIKQLFCLRISLFNSINDDFLSFFDEIDNQNIRDPDQDISFKKSCR